MKQITLMLTVLVIAFGASAQKKVKASHSTKTVVTKVKTTGKPVVRGYKAPTQVAASFAAEYPNATNVVWTKSSGNWTSAYTVNGYRTIATYHANGKRVDTRTYIPVAQAPQPVTIYQQSAGSSIRIGKIVQIDLPGATPVYQVRTTTGTIVYLDGAGKVITFKP